MVSQDIINQIIDKVNIAEVISEYIPILPDGSGSKAVCPFHNDTHPSMKISTTKKIFKCFSCGAGGNVIQFVQKYEKISFLEAVSKLAKRIGIDINVNNDPDYLEKKKLYDCLKECNNFYKFYLFNSEEGKQALEYLNNRGITKEIIDKFEIGLAPSEKDYLHQALNNLEISLIDQVESGMVRTNDKDGSVTDAFRTRIMFPLKDLQGHIVGFSGRIYEAADNRPKYVNSNENLVFHKSDVLYNFYQAQEDIRVNGDVFVFEGFMDVIAASKANVNNAVATMGTALTKQHIKALNQVARRIVLCFDGDTAGIEATHKATKLLGNFNIIPYAVAIPEGLDPDEYQIKYGSRELNKYLLNNQTNVYEYMYSIAKKDLIVNDVVSIQKFKNRVFEFLKGVNPTIKEFYLNKLSTDINVDIPTLIKDFNDNDSVIVEPKKPKQVIVINKHIPKKVYLAIEIAINHMLTSRDKYTVFYCDYLHFINVIDFPDYIDIILRIGELYNQGVDEINIESVKEYFSNKNESVSKLFDKIISNNMLDTTNNDEFEECLKTIREHSDKNYTDSKFKDAIENGNNDIINDYMELLRKTKTIK